MGNKVIVLVPCREKEESYNELEVKIENIRSMLRKMEQQMEMKFKAGIGSVVSWEEVSKSYREALDTARQGVGKVNHAKDLPVSCVYEEGYPYDMESGLLMQFTQGCRTDRKKKYRVCDVDGEAVSGGYRTMYARK